MMVSIKVIKYFIFILTLVLCGVSSATMSCSSLLAETSNSFVGVNISIGANRGDSFLISPATGARKELPKNWYAQSSPHSVSDSKWQMVSGREDFNTDLETFSSHKTNYINVETGELLLKDISNDEPKIMSGFGFRHGLALVQTNKGSAILNENGDVTVTEWGVTWKSPIFSNGVTLASIPSSNPMPGQGPSTEASKMAENVFVNVDGKIHRPEIGMSLPLVKLGGFYKGLALFAVAADYSKTRDWKWGYLNGDFKVEIPPVFNKVLDFVEDHAWAYKDETWGVIDRTGNYKATEVNIEPTPLVGTGMSYVVSDNFDKAYIYSNDGEMLFEIQHPESPSSISENKEGQLPVVTNHEEFPWSVDYIGRNMINFKYGKKFYTFDIKNRDFISSLSGNFRIDQPFTNGHAKFSLYYMNDRGSRGVGEGYIGFDGQVAVFTPNVGSIGLISSADGPQQDVNDIIPTLIEAHSDDD